MSKKSAIAQISVRGQFGCTFADSHGSNAFSNHVNFARIHGSAQAAGVTDKLWEIDDIIKLVLNAFLNPFGGSRDLAVSVYSIGVHFLCALTKALQYVRGKVIVLHVLKALLNNLTQVESLGASGLRRQKIKLLLGIGSKSNRTRHVAVPHPL